MEQFKSHRQAEMSALFRHSRELYCFAVAVLGCFPNLAAVFSLTLSYLFSGCQCCALWQYLL